VVELVVYFAPSAHGSGISRLHFIFLDLLLSPIHIDTFVRQCGGTCPSFSNGNLLLVLAPFTDSQSIALPAHSVVVGRDNLTLTSVTAGP
jgi:hypothetical protein